MRLAFLISNERIVSTALDARFALDS
jgi:hypothetical protein